MLRRISKTEPEFPETFKVEISVRPYDGGELPNDPRWSAFASISAGKSVHTASMIESSRDEIYRKAARAVALDILDLAKVLP